MAQKTYTAVRPRRRIEQVYAHDPSQAVTNVSNTEILHEADDRQTLVRIVGKVRFQLTGNPGAGVMGACNAQLAISPGGTEVTTPATNQELDQVKQKQLMLDTMFGIIGTGAVATDAQQNDQIDIDIKGQRVLAKGDEVVLRHIGNGANIGQLTYSLTMIFKE